MLNVASDSLRHQLWLKNSLQEDLGELRKLRLTEHARSRGLLTLLGLSFVLNEGSPELGLLLELLWQGFEAIEGRDLQDPPPSLLVEEVSAGVWARPLLCLASRRQKACE